MLQKKKKEIELTLIKVNKTSIFTFCWEVNQTRENTQDPMSAFRVLLFSMCFLLNVVHLNKNVNW